MPVVESEIKNIINFEVHPDFCRENVLFAAGEYKNGDILVKNDAGLMIPVVLAELDTRPVAGLCIKNKTFTSTASCPALINGTALVYGDCLNFPEAVTPEETVQITGQLKDLDIKVI